MAQLRKGINVPDIHRASQNKADNGILEKLRNDLISLTGDEASEMQHEIFLVETRIAVRNSL
tara:strand:- start:7946 stop:8131 length:186 start_codon:yes stop_codon:yes gene_type:complete